MAIDLRAIRGSGPSTTRLRLCWSLWWRMVTDRDSMGSSTTTEEAPFVPERSSAPATSKVLCVECWKMAKRTKKCNYTETEVDVLITEVDAKAGALFGSLSLGITTKRKNAAWEAVTDAVNSISPQQRTVAEIKKKWFDVKLMAKKRLADYKKNASATGGGQSQSELSPLDMRIASIIGNEMVEGIPRTTDTDTYDVAGPSSQQVEGNSAELLLTVDPIDTQEEQEASCSRPPSACRGQRVHPVLTEAVMSNQETTRRRRRRTITLMSDMRDEMRLTRQTMAEYLPQLVAVLSGIGDSLQKIAEKEK